jgi:hypothetical protein
MNKIIKKAGKRHGRHSANGTNGVMAKSKPRAPAAAPRRVKKAPQEPSQVPGLTQGELKELKEALDEYEVNKGDWSKGR